MSQYESNVILLTICSAVAAVAGAVQDLRKHTDKGFEWSMLYSALISAFTGFIAATLVLRFYAPDNLVAVAAAGIAGWTGPGLLDLISAAFQKLVQSKLPDAKPPEPPKAPGSN